MDGRFIDLVDSGSTEKADPLMRQPALGWVTREFCG